MLTISMVIPSPAVFAPAIKTAFAPEYDVSTAVAVSVSMVPLIVRIIVPGVAGTVPPVVVFEGEVLVELQDANTNAAMQMIAILIFIVEMSIKEKC